MSFFKAHAVWLTTVAVGLVSFLTPSVQAFVAVHPQYAVTVGTIWGVAAAWARSPKS